LERDIDESCCLVDIVCLKYQEMSKNNLFDKIFNASPEEAFIAANFSPQEPRPTLEDCVTRIEAYGHRRGLTSVEIRQHLGGLYNVQQMILNSTETDNADKAWMIQRLGVVEKMLNLYLPEAEKREQIEDEIRLEKGLATSREVLKSIIEWTMNQNGYFESSLKNIEPVDYKAGPKGETSEDLKTLWIGDETHYETVINKLQETNDKKPYVTKIGLKLNWIAGYKLLGAFIISCKRAHLIPFNNRIDYTQRRLNDALNNTFNITLNENKELREDFEHTAGDLKKFDFLKPKKPL
jgi:hypothetical protein